MKALVYTATQQSEIRNLDLPVAGDGEAVIDVAFCGICGSDMHAWHGHDERRIPPLVLGHEAAGIVRNGALAGSRVAINPLMTCGDCPACNNGAEHLCPTRELIGMRVAGAFAEQVAIAERNLTVISDDLSFVEAALAEPLACAVNAVRLAVERCDDRAATVVVLGGGAIGLLAAMVFADHGFTNIWVAETNEYRRKMLAQFGIFQTYDPLSDSPKASVIDIVLDAVGSGPTRRAASAMVRPGGVIVHIGLQDNEAGLDTRRITLQEISFIGAYCYRQSDFAAAIRLLERGVVTGAGWAEVRPLEEGAGSFEDIHNGVAPPKIILDMNA